MLRMADQEASTSVLPLAGSPSVLGTEWVALFQTAASFETLHFEKAMQNLIREPNINSTVILRADILIENTTSQPGGDITSVRSPLADSPPDIPTTSSPDVILSKNLDDLEVRQVPLKPTHRSKVEIVRRIVPRNPFKDSIINQTCSILQLDCEGRGLFEDTLVLYYPHIGKQEDCPFYLPSVQAVGILLSQGQLSCHYLPFNYTDPSSVSQFPAGDDNNRDVRIALRLLQTAKKHSTGVQSGYQKRVEHDRVVSKVAFQDRYIALKKKYSKQLVEQWVESTDPRKHVFEDIAIAAFLIELWGKIYGDKTSFEFRDIGCGNGLLVHLLLSEGFVGQGIDARARKSWKVYPQSTQQALHEQVIIPSVLLRPHPAVSALAPHLRDNGRVFQVPVPNISEPGVPTFAYHSSASLLSSPLVHTAEFPNKDTFIIGNHSDELTCWIPLLGYPFLVIPCCSHGLNGARVRYPVKKQRQQVAGNSTYVALVDHVEDVAKSVGWKVEREMLRIPSTRNAAIIGYEREKRGAVQSVYDILLMEGGAEGWVENTMALTKRAPRSH